MTCRSLVYGLSISRSRATICRSSSPASISASPVSLFIPSTSSGRVAATTKSAPRRLNVSTGAGAPGRSRFSVSRRSLPVRSGFCSEPDSANSFSRIFWVSTNHEWSKPLSWMAASVPRVSKPGKFGAGKRWPRASNHSDEGPGRILMPCSAQTGSQFWMPSV